ncbi:hypothetical protein ACFC18_48935 [Streptomyces sp. NPDC056121]|uniref:hypothetical protein n=1 Tax=unclassified Streptomyces TaxID=2593676 RepID=UPI0035D8EB9D
MSDSRPEAPVPEPTPRDMPDQQAGAGPDPWDEDETGPSDEERPEPDTEIPDTDEAGTGRRGAPHAGSPNPDHPVPEESSG